MTGAGFGDIAEARVERVGMSASMPSVAYDDQTISKQDRAIAQASGPPADTRRSPRSRSVESTTEILEVE